MVKLIHRLWLGSEMPGEYKEYGDLWRQLNPGWEVIDHTELPDIMYNPSFEIIADLYRRDNQHYSEELWVQVADVCGYEFVCQYGGLYVNCDIEPLRPVEPLFEQAAGRAIVTAEDDYFVVNAVLGSAEPEHPFWHKVIETAYEKYFANPGAMMVHTTGPQMLTPLALEGRLENDVVIFPRSTFNPVHWADIPLGGDASLHVDSFRDRLDVYGVHHWAHRKSGRSNTVGA